MTGKTREEVAKEVGELGGWGDFKPLLTEVRAAAAWRGEKGGRSGISSLRVESEAGVVCSRGIVCVCVGEEVGCWRGGRAALVTTARLSPPGYHRSLSPLVITARYHRWSPPLVTTRQATIAHLEPLQKRYNEIITEQVAPTLQPSCTLQCAQFTTHAPA